VAEVKLAIVNACYQPSDNLYFEKVDSLKSAMESMSIDSEYDITFFCCTQDSYNKTLHHAGVTYDFSTGAHVMDAIKNCSRRVAQWKPDGIIIEDFNNPVVPMLQRMLPEVPKLLIFCGGELKPPPIPCKAVMVASEAMKKVLESQGCRGRIFSSAFTVDTKLFSPDPSVRKEYDIIYVADWRENKRQQLLIEALSRGAINSCCCVGAQSGIYSESYFKSMKPFIARMGVGGKIVMIDRIPGHLMPAHYHKARICIHLGMSTEGGARSVMEAMACGLPVIVANDCLSNTSRVEHGKEGLHCEPTPASIHRAARQLLNNPLSIESYGAAARKKAVSLWYLKRMEEDFREVFPCSPK
jgi:glycosyltransferase involved in cell wall biosynthesis